jgi:hypothetical protein
VDVPVVGASGFLSSYVAAVKFISTGRGLVEDGYAKYKGKVFQAAERNHWHVFFTSSKSVDELRKFPDEVLSADIAADEVRHRQVLFIRIFHSHRLRVSI